MLYIKEHLKDAEANSTWHVGEPMPYIKARVVTFQADGDELNLILDAMSHKITRDPMRQGYSNKEA